MKSKRAREVVEPEGSHVDPIETEAPPKKRKRTGDEDTVDLKKSKKDKKEKKDRKDKKDKKHRKESRKERKEKRKDLQDLPDQDDEELDDSATPDVKGGVEESPAVDTAPQPPADAADSDKSAKRDEKKEKRDKKNKNKKAKDELQDADINTTTTTNGEAENATSANDNKKKQKKEKREKKTAQNDTSMADADAEVEGDADATGQKNDRHIVFVGNLPFSATAATIKAHFASLSPSSVRCMSDPKSDKPCRGFAFVEFGKVWHMRTCLDKLHHSMFDDKISPPRRINVELTAGGGGKTKQRQDKIREKNRKLEENRTKRIEREKAAKDESRANGNAAGQQGMEDNIHPSRRGQVRDY